SFTAPGDDLMCGTATKFEIRTSNSPVDESNFGSATDLTSSQLPAPEPGAAGTSENFHLPAATQRYVAVRAVDDQGNVGRVASIDTQGGGGGGNGGAGGKSKAPNTHISKARIRSHQGKARFRFRGIGGTPPYRFQCRIAAHGKTGHRHRAAGFRSCRRIRVYRHLAPGVYRFAVRAIDSA